jgi:hypothetical protein
MFSFRQIKSILFPRRTASAASITKPAPQPAPYDKLALDAFHIADQSMMDVLRTECICQDPEKMRMWPVSPSGMKVQTVAEAGPQIQRALDWCRQRGIVKIESNEWDELIVLTTPTA